MTTTSPTSPTAERRAAGSEDGFTLIELIVVVLIIGILAAIALPVFLNHKQKGQDSVAKANARNLVTHAEACYTELGGYVGCTARLTSLETGLPIGSGANQVQITAESATGYTIVAVSRAITGGVNHSYTIVREGAAITHDCQVPGEGGCPADGDW